MDPPVPPPPKLEQSFGFRALLNDNANLPGENLDALIDPKNVGYDADQSPFKSGRFVADPANANGNGNGGHEYGTTLTDEQRWAIIEYLKTL